MSTQTVERMAVEVDGEGTPVVMVHGLGGTSNTFTPQMGLFRSGYRVIRPDLPGSGRSPYSGDLSISGFVATLAKACRVLGVDKAHFVGHSLGTIVCQHLAVEHPSLVRSLSLFGPISEPPDAARKGLKDRAAKARAEGMADIADAIVQAATSAETKEHNPLAVALVREMVMRQPADGYAATCEALAGASAADVTRIRCPVLLATGDEDGVAPASGARAIGEKMEKARTKVLNRCGHWATFEKVEDTNRELRDFMTSVRTA